MRAQTVVNYIEDRPTATWTDVVSQFGKDANYWVRALRRLGRTGLIERVGSRSGTKRRHPYGETLIQVLEYQPDLTWAEIEAMFGKTQAQIRATLAHYQMEHLAKGRKP